MADPSPSSSSRSPPPLLVSTLPVASSVSVDRRVSAPLPEAWKPLKGMGLSWSQFGALTKKNVLIRKRAWKTNFLLISQVVMFVALTWIVDQAVSSSNQRRPAYSDIPVAKPQTIGTIPDCSENLFMRRDADCYTLLYAPQNIPLVETIMAGIRESNAIPPGHTKGFQNGSEIDSYLLAHPNTVLAAVEFVIDSPTSVGFSVQTNSSIEWFKGKFQNANLYAALPVQVAVEREIYKAITGKNTVDWQVQVTEFSHPSANSPSAVANFAPTFTFASIMFQFIFQLHDLLQERESGARRLMGVMGLKNTPYWASWIMWQGLIAIIEALLLIALSYAFGFEMFTENDFRLSFLLILEVSLATTSFGFFVAAFLRKAGSAVPVGFFIFVVAWVFLIVLRFGFPFNPKFSPVARGFFSIMPWVMLGKGIDDLAEAAAGKRAGLAWSDRTAYCQVDIPSPELQQTLSFWRTNCVTPLSQIYFILLIQMFAYLVLAIYLENVLPDETGTHRAPWYFLSFRYWFPSKHPDIRKAQAALEASKCLEVPDPDVRAEEEAMQKQCEAYIKAKGDAKDSGTGDQQQKHAVEMFGLNKTYASGVFRKKKFAAVKNNWFGVREGECFCLLGPNGAGKTTTIHCLTGVLPISAGDALVYDTSIATVKGLEKTRPIMGVCPQFDTGLWGLLTGREHLNLFASIKGIPWSARAVETARLLEDVKLTEAAETTSAAYSGGMKRRLSVAIALSGNPRIVYLDEPTTGLDPISRRHLWDLVDRAKHNRAIILTTHSMEEADILGDRIGIMVRGSLQCIGTSLRLKSRFGSGYRVSVRVQTEGDARGTSKTLEDLKTSVKIMFMNRLGVKSADETQDYVHFLVPYENEDKLPLMLAHIKSRKSQLGIGDVQLRLTPLEEVFLNVTKKAELQHAEAEGRYEPLLLVEEKITIKVPIGAEFIQSPNGQFYHVQWMQDDAGCLKLKDYHRDSLNGKLEHVKLTQAKV